MKKVLSANTLKLIAVVAMVLDHIAVGFVAQTSVLYFIMRTIGKITAPIMCYFIAEGYFHTHNLKRYMLRLLIFALISHFPYVLYFSFANKVTSSIMLPLLLGLCALTLYKNETLSKPIRYIGIVLCFIGSLPCDWSCMPVFFILIFGIYHDNTHEMLVRFSVVGAIFALVNAIEDIHTAYMAGVLLSVPLLYMYSGQLGKKSPILKWSFYIFYPAHLLVLYAIKALLV